MAKSSVKDSMQFRDRGGSSGAYTYNQNYEYSDIRTWLLSYVENFSSTDSTLYNHLATMDVVYNFNTNQPNNQLYIRDDTPDTNTNTTGSNKHTLNDKIKLLSGTELGYTSGISYMPYNEGNIYSNKFSSKSSNSADSNMIWYSGSSNSAISWWTRSRSSGTNGSCFVYSVGTGGNLFTGYTYNSYSVVPVIRLSV